MTQSCVLRPRTVALLGAALALCAPAAGGQEAEPSATAEYRVAVMEALRAHTGAMRAVLTDSAPFASSLPAHAAAVRELAAVLEHAFPGGSGGAATRSEDEIWLNPAGFSERMAVFRSAADALDRAAASGNAAETGAALQAMGQSCAGCHRDFRRPVS